MTILFDYQAAAQQASLEHNVGQFIYPTGTGKTIIEAHIISAHIKAGNIGTYVVLAPRIMLSQQLFSEIWKQVVDGSKIDCHFFSLHSGKAVKFSDVAKKKKNQEDTDVIDEDDWVEVRRALEAKGINTSRNFDSGTSGAKLLAAQARARQDGVPLIVCSTYHSAKRLQNIEIDVLIADEAHNAVSNEFSHVHELNAQKRFYFTATRKLTAGELGMNNEEAFGPILGKMSPLEAVLKKLIVRPRLHFVEIKEEIQKDNEFIADSAAIEAALDKHGMMTRGIAPKLLVAARGTTHLKKVLQKTNHFERLRRTRPGLQVFSIISGKGMAQINGEVVTREVFMAKLKGLQDNQPAIIMHYDILSEGIDVPGITGIMPLRDLGLSKFLQTLGRATRLHVLDRAIREKLSATEEGWEAEYVKPFAWIIIPCYGSTGSEIAGSIDKHIALVREFGWTPEEGVVISEAGGDAEPEDVESMINRPGARIPSAVIEIQNVFQRIEEKEKTDAELQEFRSMSDEELFAF